MEKEIQVKIHKIGPLWKKERGYILRLRKINICEQGKYYDQLLNGMEIFSECHKESQDGSG